MSTDRPSCEACGDWDTSVRPVRIDKRVTANLCAVCANNDEVARVLAEEGRV